MDLLGNLATGGPWRIEVPELRQFGRRAPPEGGGSVAWGAGIRTMGGGIQGLGSFNGRYQQPLRPKLGCQINDYEG